MQKKGLSFAAYFSVKMPDTWTPTFDLSDLQKVRRINLNAEQEIDFAIKKIQSRSAGDYMRNKVPTILAKTFYGLDYNAMRKASHFKVENSCIGCGLCYSACPQKCIDITKRPVVIDQHHCLHCGRCAEICPVQAIEKRF